MSHRRNHSVDAFRLMASFGVVMAHLAPSTHAAEAFTLLLVMFRVPFFFMISLYYFVSRARKLPLTELATLRPDRILVPCAVWTVIYTLMRMLKFHLNGQSLPINWIGFIFYGGGAVQLYFLPLLLLFQAQALSMVLLIRGGSSSLLGVIIGLSAALFGYYGDLGHHFGFAGALRNGLGYVGAAFLLNYTQSVPLGRRINFILGLFTCGLIGYGALFGFPPVALGMWQGPLLGYGLSASALNWHFHLKRPALRGLITCSYGIYLAHFGFLETFEFTAEKLNLGLTPYAMVPKLLISATICLFCCWFVIVVRRYRLPAYLLLGEITADHSPSKSKAAMVPAAAPC